MNHLLEHDYENLEEWCSTSIHLPRKLVSLNNNDMLSKISL